MKGKYKAMAIAAVLVLGLSMLAAGGKVMVTDLVISRAVINATPEEVLAWLGTEGEAFSINKDTNGITYSWWPGLEFQPIDGLEKGASFNYKAEYAGLQYSGEAIDLGPTPIGPGAPSISKYSGGHTGTFTELVVPVKEGSKLTFVLEYTLDAPSSKAQAVKQDVRQHMQNAVTIIKQGVEKKKAAAQK